MSKILVVCQEGNNRSVTLAHQLKYLGHDVLSAGLATNGIETLEMLTAWAEVVITTDAHQAVPFAYGPGHTEPTFKMMCWDLGPDTYPRPFNKQLLKKVQALVAARGHEL